MNGGPRMRPRSRLVLLVATAIMVLVLPAQAALAAAPTISSFSPTSGPVGTTVVISGSNFTGATLVAFWPNRSATFTVNNSNQITATVPANTHTGPISVTTPDGTATSTTDFVLTAGPSPTITSFSPTSGAPGTLVAIDGTNFTGVSTVVFNLTNAASFTVVNSTQITATVASGSTTGFIKVTTASGTATSSTKFTVPGTPEITSFAPTSGGPGTSVQINGNNLTGATSVKFGGGSATFTVNNSNRITATVPNSAKTGPISVTTPNGTTQSTTNFTVGTVGITSFDPERGPWGSSVVITGAGFTGATAVSFGGTNASSFTVNSSTQITAVVANGTVTGKITVTVSGASLTSADAFVIQHLRTISLSLGGGLQASGRVQCQDGTTACAQNVPVRVQRRFEGRWRNVGTGVTDAAGNYSISVPNKDGKYRAVANRTDISNGDACKRANSGVVIR